ncbi:MAG: nitroreductase family protein [Candidatus Omnitrophica bacterium]|nr:nitroreductase family protein [Candidatus Omnitrophota bacterium]
MSFLQLVQQRRSVRKYLPQVVPRERLERCFQAARLAPSACNQQPWYFLAVENLAMRQQIYQKAFTGIYSLNKFVLTAPVLVLAVTKNSGILPAIGGTIRRTPFHLIDLAIACEHFILQATEEGLGTCWLGWFNERVVKKILGLSRWERVPIIISVGYPEGQEETVSCRKSIDQIRRYI